MKHPIFSKTLKKINYLLSKKLLFTITAIYAFGFVTQAQTILLDTATVSGDTLFCNGGNDNKNAVAFNPDEQLYYSNNAGGPQPNEYFDINGNYIGDSNDTDWRGMWYNTTTKGIEGNIWSGAVVIDSLSAAGYFSATVNSLGFPSNTPDPQSTGAFDYDDDVIFYYENDSLYAISRVDGSSLATKSLTGVSNFSNIVNWIVLYTGIPQNEIGLYDRNTKTVLLFDKSTGSLTNSVHLPANTFSISGNWKISYANDLFWLYNQPLNNWVGFQIFEECPQIETTLNESICEGETYTSPLGNDYTTTTSFSETLSTAKGCDSTITISLTAENCATSIGSINTFENKNIYPNPTSGILNLDVSEELSSIRLIDLTGKTIQVFNAEQTLLDINDFTKGIYFLEISNAEKKSVIKIIKK